ncbi:MAG: PQQ-like beta-propeller repeat protein, partial [Xanthomonadales bacterium]|nr:PQQ-like beta-propeller repeat protein [Xanthomonadales bacterium]
MNAKALLVTVMVSLSVAWTFAADWPWYYGPRRDSTSLEKGVLRTWPKEGPKVLWTAALGVGFGGPAVKDGKVYLLDRDEKIGDTLRVFDLATGRALWTFAYDAPGSFMFPGSRTVPTIDGDLVYTVSAVGDLYAINTTTHKPVWHKNIWTDFGGSGVVPALRMPRPGPGAAPPPDPGRGGAPGGTPPAPPDGRQGAPAAAGPSLPTWGIVQNPLVHGDLLIVAPQTPETTVVAFDKRTGE